ncbi:MAG TPA: BON domain-containing protein [Polyangiaceae bacterium]|nr:BON domain-containing protein [Polyangiaceae bacterium]
MSDRSIADNHGPLSQQQVPPPAEEHTASDLAGSSEDRDSVPLESSVREHGVWGTKSDAVGGFGESYDAQVAHGTEPRLDDRAEEAPEDAALGREVRKTLARAHIDAADLRVAVRGDHVTLLGSVREALEKAQIEARARAIPGVAQVINRLSVLNQTDGQR